MSTSSSRDNQKTPIYAREVGMHDKLQFIFLKNLISWQSCDLVHDDIGSKRHDSIHRVNCDEYLFLSLYIYKCMTVCVCVHACTDAFDIQICQLRQ